jgi:hypothetical protein
MFETNKGESMSETKQGKTRDYTVSIFVDRTPEEVFAAINSVRSWWIGDIEGNTDQLGSEFTYTYKHYHRTTQKVIELIPNQKVSWLVTQSKIGFVRNQSEWTSTKIVFELTPENEGTRLVFTHIGLTPAFECFDGCSGGWSFYIEKSLRSLILTGKGCAPNF